MVTDLAAKSDQSQALVRTIRALPGPGGTTVLVTGAVAQLIDTRSVLSGRRPGPAGSSAPA